MEDEPSPSLGKKNSVVVVNNQNRVSVPVPSQISAILEAGSAPVFLMINDETDETYFTGEEDDEREELLDEIVEPPADFSARMKAKTSPNKTDIYSSSSLANESSVPVESSAVVHASGNGEITVEEASHIYYPAHAEPASKPITIDKSTHTVTCNDIINKESTHAVTPSKIYLPQKPILSSHSPKESAVNPLVIKVNDVSAKVNDVLGRKAAQGSSWVGARALSNAAFNGEKREAWNVEETGMNPGDESSTVLHTKTDDNLPNMAELPQTKHVSFCQDTLDSPVIRYGIDRSEEYTTDTTEEEEEGDAVNCEQIEQEFKSEPSLKPIISTKNTAIKWQRLPVELTLDHEHNTRDNKPVTMDHHERNHKHETMDHEQLTMDHEPMNVDDEHMSMDHKPMTRDHQNHITVDHHNQMTVDHRDHVTRDHHNQITVDHHDHVTVDYRDHVTMDEEELTVPIPLVTHAADKPNSVLSQSAGCDARAIQQEFFRDFENVSEYSKGVSECNEDVSECNEGVLIRNEGVSINNKGVSLCNEDVSMFNEDVSNITEGDGGFDPGVNEKRVKDSVKVRKNDSSVSAVDLRSKDKYSLLFLVFLYRYFDIFIAKLFYIGEIKKLLAQQVFAKTCWASFCPQGFFIYFPNLE